MKLKEAKSNTNSLKNNADVNKSTGKLFKLGGATDATQHSINEDEHEAFTTHINQTLRNDEDLKSRLPIDVDNFNALYEACSDGLLLRYDAHASGWL